MATNNFNSMKLLKMTIVILILLLIFSFYQNNNISKAELLGCWVHSQEEDYRPYNNQPHIAVRVYRHCNYKVFGRSWYRHRMELKGENKCLWLYLAEDDGHYMVDGTWFFNKDSCKVEILNTNGIIVKKFKILKLEKDIMEFIEE